LRRCKYDIIADLLRTLSESVEGLKITELCMNANIPVDRGHKLIKWLEERGLIYEEFIEGSHVFKITSLGYTYLSLYGELSKILG